MKKEEKKKKELHAGGKVKLIAACLVMSAIVFFILISIEKNMMQAYEKISVVAVKQEIPERTLITEKNADVYLEIKEVEKAAAPDSSFQSVEELYGKRTAAALEKGVIPTPAMVEEHQKILEGMENPVIAGISADDIYQIVGGVLRAGDKIHIYSVDRESSETRLVWPDIMVVQAFDSSGTEIADSDTAGTAQRINIYVEKDQVEELYTALASGSLRIVKEAD